ncbi:hypothetical protein [Micromonospora sagamiensis]|uniref:Peptidase MA superfamily protein n=1 Tax=Micromonospora sagamiensis TaxID=47875 RepID=A0A562W9F9_9ACTN|nr:hypothetical protein [Micromonospora sagamiensis]TWJ26933.1 hypothetical protein JD81_00415 [Micromonospora sagamiensis]BCL14178.1 hypothetical protein GCM10017556_19170 [Micromonospora sagamiensis]
MAYSPAVEDERHGLRRRRRGLLWAAVAVVAVALGCLLPAALVAAVVRETADRSADEKMPRPGGPASGPVARLAAAIDTQLERQSGALLRGDRDGFLAVAEPAARGDLTRRFASLRALRIAVWWAEPSGQPAPAPGQPGQWRQLVTYRYCLVVPDCTPSPVLAATRWREAPDGPRLVAVEPSVSAETGTRPWEVSELVTAVGPRTVVATTVGLRARLPGLLAEAEAAAAVADGYAVDGIRPDRYRIFYAGRDEWRRWYGGGRPAWTGGYVVTVGGGHHEVVLNADALRTGGVADLLRHELTHAASLPAGGWSGRHAWWLVEGMAELAGVGGRPVGRYAGLDDVRRLLVGGGWDGRLDTLAPADDAPADRVAASYGVGYLAVRYLVDRYGGQRLLDFFAAVVHDRRPVAEAARKVYGEPWSELHDECVARVRAVAA